jgi:hypothetical protein
MCVALHTSYLLHIKIHRIFYTYALLHAVQCVCLICILSLYVYALYVCLICMPHMHALYSAYALYVSLMCRPYM